MVDTCKRALAVEKILAFSQTALKVRLLMQKSKTSNLNSKVAYDCWNYYG